MEHLLASTIENDIEVIRHWAAPDTVGSSFDRGIYVDVLNALSILLEHNKKEHLLYMRVGDQLYPLQLRKGLEKMLQNSTERGNHPIAFAPTEVDKINTLAKSLDIPVNMLVGIATKYFANMIKVMEGAYFCYKAADKSRLIELDITFNSTHILEELD